MTRVRITRAPGGPLVITDIDTGAEITGVRGYVLTERYREPARLTLDLLVEKVEVDVIAELADG